ncbi:MAG: hypothetical protein BWY09_03126 [Candidatus Hydrogenedentes bacterium ADurb.Bin179]|nr:MAG: hypothetical protein BWY09_03126 [Candidatus Hydrogenedentes bacterium ADurb.Bin179]
MFRIHENPPVMALEPGNGFTHQGQVLFQGNAEHITHMGNGTLGEDGHDRCTRLHQGFQIGVVIAMIFMVARAAESDHGTVFQINIPDAFEQVRRLGIRMWLPPFNIGNTERVQGFDHQ